MPVFRLPPDEPLFPSAELAEPDGLLAIGGDLSPERLIEAYAAGILPWYSEGEPILWWSLVPRWIVEPGAIHVPRSLRRTIRRGTYRYTADEAFEQVVERCARAPREGQSGTWITRDMRRAYLRLHELGLAHSVEAWDERGLAGGLHGVSLGGVFFGESMFADRADASKGAFVRLCRLLADWGFDMIDCQMHTEHLERFGAKALPRRRFLERLDTALDRETRQGPWTLREPAPGGAGEEE